MRRRQILESNEKDSSNEHENFTLDIPCSFNATLESGMLSAPCTHEDYNHLMVLFCKFFKRLVVMYMFIVNIADFASAPRH